MQDVTQGQFFSGVELALKKCVNFWTVPAGHRLNVKYQDFAREIKKLWNIKVAMMPIIAGAVLKKHSGVPYWCNG